MKVEEDFSFGVPRSLQFDPPSRFPPSNPARSFGGDEARSTGSLHPNLDRRRSDVSATATGKWGTAGVYFRAPDILYRRRDRVQREAQNLRRIYPRRSAETDYQRRREKLSSVTQLEIKSLSSFEFLLPREFLPSPPPSPSCDHPPRLRRAVYI